MNPLEKFKKFPFDWNALKASGKTNLHKNYWHNVIETEACLKPVLEYLMKEYSANRTAKILHDILKVPMTAKAIIRWCKNWNIPTHSFSEAARLPSCREMHEKTNFERYGAVNTLSRGTVTYQKKIETVKRKYGVDNIRKSKEFQETRKKTMLQRYGATAPVYLDNYQRSTGRRSKLQRTVENWLSDLGIPFKVEVPNLCEAYNSFLGKSYNPIVDILIESEEKIVVEVFGDRWHANPKKYKDSDIIPCWRGDLTAERIRTFDEHRIRQIESFGYKVIVLWESDIVYNPETVKNILQKLKK